MRTIQHHVINGIVEVNGVRFWRISYLWKTVALVRAYTDDEANPEAMDNAARAVCDALNRLECDQQNALEGAE